MKAVIVEDEQIASSRLKGLIEELAPDITVVKILSSVESGKDWFLKSEAPDLIFLDIQLNDGYGFDVLDELENHPPVIFTTAYNEYAIRSFKYNGLDYLLKPIDKKDLKRALDKYRLSPYNSSEIHVSQIGDLKKLLVKEYKRRFIVKVGNHFSSFDVDNIFFFKSHNGIIHLYTSNGKCYPVEYSLDQLEEILNPIDFFRINRQYVISLNSVMEIHHYFNSRLLLKLTPFETEKVIVSRERCTAFKKWLDL